MKKSLTFMVLDNKTIEGSLKIEFFSANLKKLVLLFNLVLIFTNSRPIIILLYCYHIVISSYCFSPFYCIHYFLSCLIYTSIFILKCSRIRFNYQVLTSKYISKKHLNYIRSLKPKPFRIS